MFCLKLQENCAILSDTFGRFPGNEVIPTEKKGIKIAAQNRKAFDDYFVEDRYEAGIELKGTEVKSIRAGNLNLKDAWCGIKNGAKRFGEKPVKK